jgi:hypothetical protein
VASGIESRGVTNDDDASQKVLRTGTALGAVGGSAGRAALGRGRFRGLSKRSSGAFIARPPPARADVAVRRAAGCCVGLVPEPAQRSR